MSSGRCPACGQNITTGSDGLLVPHKRAFMGRYTSCPGGPVGPHFEIPSELRERVAREIGKVRREFDKILKTLDPFVAVEKKTYSHEFVTWESFKMDDDMPCLRCPAGDWSHTVRGLPVWELRRLAEAHLEEVCDDDDS